MREMRIAEFAAQAFEHEARWTPAYYKERIAWLLECAALMRQSTNPTLIRVE
jgi:hypothetical protein